MSVTEGLPGGACDRRTATGRTSCRRTWQSWLWRLSWYQSLDLLHPWQSAGVIGNEFDQRSTENAWIVQFVAENAW